MLCGGDNGFIKLEKVAESTIPEDLLLPDLGSVTPDAKGNIFAFAGRRGTAGDCFIIKFDADLRFVKKFGRDGKGPGEFTSHLQSIDNRISVDSVGNVYVFDHNPMRVVIFDNRGNYREDIRFTGNYIDLVGNLYKLKALGNGHFLGIRWLLHEPCKALLFTLKPRQIKFEYTYGSQKIRTKNQDFRDLYYGENNLLDTDTNYFILAESQVYRFRLYDRQGNLKFEVYDKKRTMDRFSSKEMKMIKDSYLPNSEYSQSRNDFNRQITSQKSLFKTVLGWIEKSKNVIVDVRLGGDRIFVFTVSPDITVKDRFPVEIYDLNGKLLKKAYFRKIPLKIRENYAFYFERDKEDNPYLIKFKMLDLP
jgi:hypothetical protein